MIKIPGTLVCCLLALTSSSHFASAEVDPEQIPGDTNWLLHLDVTSIQKTELWTQLGEEQFKRVIEENDIPLDPDKLIDVIESITLLGSSFDTGREFDGVVVIQGKPELTSIVEALILSLVEPAEEEADADSAEPTEPPPESPYPVYSVGSNVTIALLSDTHVAISKSSARIARCFEVMAGNETNLAESNNLGSFGNTRNLFFQMAATASAHEGPVPPPLDSILRMIEGLQFNAGEIDHSIVLEIVAQAKTEETALAMSDVVAGMSTLAGISHPDNEFLVALTDGIEVETTGQAVNASVRYPTETIVELIRSILPTPFESVVGDDAQGGERLKMQLSASSTDKEYRSGNTLDGDPETRWSAQGKNHWLRYELAQETMINGVGIAWYMGDTRKRNFEVDLSSDGTTWTTVHQGNSSGETSEIESYTFEAASAGWIQIRFTSEDEITWHSVSEVELIGSNPEITASRSSPDGVSSPVNATDGDLETRWSESGETWLLFELDERSVIQEAAIAWYQGNTRESRFELQVSDDRENWTTILRHESAGKTTELERANTVDTPARWVKLIGLGNSESGWTSITNFELYGVPVD